MNKRHGSEVEREVASKDELFFENLPSLLRVEAAASLLGISKKTVYDWKYRSLERKIPLGLFIKFNGALYIQTKILKRWILAQNPNLK